MFQSYHKNIFIVTIFSGSDILNIVNNSIIKLGKELAEIQQPGALVSTSPLSYTYPKKNPTF